MNKPAPKEPSMDEILSSIRQIIAEDDAMSRMPSPSTPLPAAPTPPDTTAFTHSIPAPANNAVQPVPLALSAEQIVPLESHDAHEPHTIRSAVELGQSVLSSEPGEREFTDLPEEEAGGASFDESHLVEGDDVAFEEEEFVPPAPTPVLAQAPVTPQRPVVSPVSSAAPLPDATLSSDIAEQLLKPATDAAVRHTFNRLGNVSLGTPTKTLEDMMRELLRPMLKEWLDENLPSVVERMVEREIARISRGIE